MKTSVLAASLGVAMIGCGSQAESVSKQVPATALQPLTESDWITTTSAPSAVRGATATLLGNGELLIAGGSPSRLWRFDPVRGLTTDLGVLNEARMYHCAAALLDGRVLLAGGAQPNSPNGRQSTELFDPKTNSVTLGPSLVAERTRIRCARMTDGRVLIVAFDFSGTDAQIFDPATDTIQTTGQPNAAATTADPSVLLAHSSGKVVLLAGKSPQLFDPSAGSNGAFSTVSGSLGTLAEPIESVFSAVEMPNGRVRFFGSDICVQVSGVPPSCIDDTHTLNLTTGAVGNEANILDAGITDHASLLMPSGEVLMAGGAPSPKRTRLYRFDSVIASRAGAPLPIPRPTLTGAILPNGAAGLVGDVGDASFGEPLDSLWQEGEPQGGPNLDRVRIDATATVLPSGEVLIAGGGGACPTINNPGDVADTAVTFDVTAGVTSTIQLQSARRGHNAVLLDDGGVLLVGGTTSGPGEGGNGSDMTAPLATAEVVAGSASTAVGAMTAARRFAAAVRMPNGKILVLGGEDGNGPLASTEVYDQATQTFSPGPVLPFAQANPDAVLLEDGTVLVVGTGAAATLDGLSAEFVSIQSPGFARSAVDLALLPNGKVLVTGSKFAHAEPNPPSGEIYDPLTRLFRPSGGYVELKTDERPSVQLLSGRRLFAGGRGQVLEVPWVFNDGSTSVSVFDALTDDGAGRFKAASDLATPRQRHVLATTPDGTVLVAGGSDWDHTGLVLGCEVGKLTTEVVRPPYEAARRPTLDASMTTARSGEVVDLTGTRLLGVRSAVHGSVERATGSVPTMAWRPVSNEGLVRGTVESWSDTSLKWRVPPTGLHGPGWLSVVVNGIPSVSVPFTIAVGDLGAPCARNLDCASAECVDGVCCDSACDGVCEACSAALKGAGVDGTCGPVLPAQSTDDLCVIPQGSSCAVGDECVTGNCVDGVCCDTACVGQCEACDVGGSLGTCVPVLGEPRGGRTACQQGSATEPCQTRVCDGVDRVACAGYVGAETACREASCADGVETLAAACDGQGSCPTPKTNTCTPYVCGATACATPPCRDDEDCESDFRCRLYQGFDYGECVVRQTACEGSVVTTADGETIDCSPYVCDDTGCLENCETASDCVAGKRCSAQRECVDATATTADDGGCSCRTAGGNGGVTRHAWWLALGAAAAFAGRARRPGVTRRR